MPSTSTQPSATFLSLPVELRLQIYSYALEHNPAVTVSTAELTGDSSDIVHRLYGDNRTPLSGIPQYHVPVIEPRYDPSLLSISHSPRIPAAGRPRAEEEGSCNVSTCPALFLVNRQIYSDLKQHFPTAHKYELSLFISFPYGLHVFDCLASHLLSCVHTVHIAGQYFSDSFSATHSAFLPAESQSKQRPSTPPPDSSANLSHIVSTILGPSPRVARLNLRIYYPGVNSYSTVWGDDGSPITVALRNIYAGQINIETWRGRDGTGIQLSAQPSKDGRRCVNTVWKSFDEGRGVAKDVNRWLVETEWPDSAKFE